MLRKPWDFFYWNQHGFSIYLPFINGKAKGAEWYRWSLVSFTTNVSSELMATDQPLPAANGYKDLPNVAKLVCDLFQKLQA